MLSLPDAVRTATRFMNSQHIRYGECVNAIEFPDGTVTLHFSALQTADRDLDSSTVIVSNTPQIILAAVNRHTGVARIPEML